MSPEIQTVAVLGAGTMGHGIAQVAAMAGRRVWLVDIARDRVDAGMDRIRRNLDGGMERGKVTEEERARTLENLTPSTDLAEAAADAQLVIEAVPETFELKAQVFTELDLYAPEDALLATNTSSISISDLQDETERPERVLGLHFFNPVHIMKLIEVVRGRRTADETIATAVAFTEAIGKEPIVVADSPGFASSRLGVALGLEAMRMVQEGVAGPEDIDKAMELGYRHPMGPLRLTDLIGLDVRLDIAEYLHETLGTDRFRPPAILRRLVEEGKLGRKSGQGFYDWSE